MSQAPEPEAVTRALVDAVWLAPSAADALQRLAEVGDQASGTASAYADVVRSNSALFGAGNDQPTADFLRSRATVDQACGILMAGRRCPPYQAFDRLVHLSGQFPGSLLEVAGVIVGETAAKPVDEPRAEN